MNNKILRKLQLEELELLKELDRICKKNNIDYFLAFGTALGAIRHKGFIPWDDDIDVTMTIDNYKKFTRIVSKELGKDFFFQNLDTDKHLHIFWSKLRKNNTLSTIKGQDKLKIHLGICMDIFPLSKLPLDIKTQKRHFKQMKTSMIILETELYKLGLKETTKTGKFIYMCLSLVPLFIRKNVSKMLIRNVLNYDGPFNQYVDYQELYKKLFIFPKELYDIKTDVLFEDKRFPIVKDYDKYLTLLYGDYMTPPPINNREAHGDLNIKFSDGEEIK